MTTKNQYPKPNETIESFARTKAARNTERAFTALEEAANAYDDAQVALRKAKAAYERAGALHEQAEVRQSWLWATARGHDCEELSRRLDELDAIIGGA